MKVLLIFVLVAVLLGQTKQEDDGPWQIFKKRFHVSFNNSLIEKIRQEIFDSNYKKIQYYRNQFKAGKLSFEVDENVYTDVSNKEFVKNKCGTRINLSKQRNTKTKTWRRRRATLPLSIDWRTKGAVTGVKNQGQCGSCWSFSATGSLEGQTYKKTSKLTSLSEQNLIDCSSNTKYGNNGCNGGLMDNAFQYIKDNKGVVTESSYPYEETQSSCRYRSANRAANVTGYINLPRYDEAQLQNAVANIGPISVAIDASLDTFQFYKSGVYYDSQCSSSSLNHGVLVVGYGTENGNDYWWVKNSWGTGWGINGYIKMARNKNNNCGIASWAVYPTI